MSESQTKAGVHYKWSEVAAEQLNPLITRQMIHTETMTIARIAVGKGAMVPEHSHANEQVSTIESGSARFVLAGVETIMHAGETMHIPAHVPHWVEALEDSVVVDLFSPRREDWIRGDDAYLRNR
jgi:quercetin dioxygenase-like cupin family protein